MFKETSDERNIFKRKPKIDYKYYFDGRSSYNDNWIHSGIERWTDHGPEEKKIYTIEDIGPAENYEDFSVNFKEMDL